MVALLCSIYQISPSPSIQLLTIQIIMETTTTTETAKFEHLIGNSVLQFWAAAEHLGTSVSLRRMEFESMTLPEIIAKNLYATKLHLDELVNLGKSILCNPYFIKYVASQGESFQREKIKIIAKKFYIVPLETAFNTEFLLETLKETALELFALLNGKRRRHEFESNNEAERTALTASVEQMGDEAEMTEVLLELSDAINVLNDVLHTQPFAFLEAEYKYS